MSSHVVDWAYLGDALTQAVAARGTSLFAVAGEVGVPAAALVALGEHTTLSADATASLLAWLFPHAQPEWVVPTASNATELVDGFGARVAALRETRGLSQNALAERVGVTPPAISQWESGKRLPDVGKLVALAAALRVTVGALFPKPRTTTRPGAA